MTNQQPIRDFIFVRVSLGVGLGEPRTLPDRGREDREHRGRIRVISALAVIVAVAAAVVFLGGGSVAVTAA